MKKIFQNKSLLKSIQIFLVCLVVLGGGLGNDNKSEAATIVSYYDPTPLAANAFSYDIYVSGNYAYVADGGGGFHSINISNPAAPVLIDTIDAFASPPNPFVAFRLFANGNHIYVTTDGQNVGDAKFFIVDISDPANLNLIGDDGYNGPRLSRDIYVSGNYAYVVGRLNVVDSSTMELQIFDISNPAAPSLVGSYDDTGIQDIEGVYVAGNYAYLACNAGGLQILDISNPAAPSLVGSYSVHTGSVYIVGNYAYLGGGGLQILDISNPAAPSLVGSGGFSSFDIHVVGNYAYLAAPTDLKIVDISNPAIPALVDSVAISDLPFGVYASGGYVYVARHNPGIAIVNPTIILSTCGDNITQNPNDTGIGGLTGIGDERCDGTDDAVCGGLGCTNCVCNAAPTPPLPPTECKPGLVPCGRICDVDSTPYHEDAPCTLCHLILMMQLIMDFLFKIAAVVAAFFIAASGTMYIFATGRPEMLSLAKTTFKLTLLGFTLIFIAWILVNTILTMFGYIDPLENNEWHIMC